MMFMVVRYCFNDSGNLHRFMASLRTMVSRESWYYVNSTTRTYGIISYMEVSINGGRPKSSILPTILGNSIGGNPHIKVVIKQHLLGIRPWWEYLDWKDVKTKSKPFLDSYATSCLEVCSWRGSVNHHEAFQCTLVSKRMSRPLVPT